MMYFGGLVNWAGMEWDEMRSWRLLLMMNFVLLIGLDVVFDERLGLIGRFAASISTPGAICVMN